MCARVYGTTECKMCNIVDRSGGQHLPTGIGPSLLSCKTRGHFAKEPKLAGDLVCRIVGLIALQERHLPGSCWATRRVWLAWSLCRWRVQTSTQPLLHGVREERALGRPRVDLWGVGVARSLLSQKPWRGAAVKRKLFWCVFVELKSTTKSHSWPSGESKTQFSEI